eukprot:Skav235505  [mRNA]  locus=scaffold625:114962:118710:- [translate_table: standard]
MPGLVDGIAPVVRLPGRQVVKELVQAGADINEEDEVPAIIDPPSQEGWTAAMRAAQHGHGNILRYFLDTGWPNLASDEGGEKFDTRFGCKDGWNTPWPLGQSVGIVTSSEVPCPQLPSTTAACPALSVAARHFPAAGPCFDLRPQRRPGKSSARSGSWPFKLSSSAALASQFAMKSRRDLQEMNTAALLAQPWTVLQQREIMEQLSVEDDWEIVHPLEIVEYVEEV